VKTSPRASALLRFLSQFIGPFDLKDALNCPAYFEVSHPDTWNSAADSWKVFQELYHSAFISVKVIEAVSFGYAKKNENSSSYQYLFEVTNKGRAALVKETPANRLIKWLFQPGSSNYTNEVPTLARLSSN
jgi:hypothetical protein